MKSSQLEEQLKATAGSSAGADREGRLESDGRALQPAVVPWLLSVLK